jgi:hypothetical protein
MRDRAGCGAHGVNGAALLRCNAIFAARQLPAAQARSQRFDVR